MARVRPKKPRIGDLVKLDSLSVASQFHTGPAVGRIGVITQCTGTRCFVQWNNGVTTKPERTALVVINHASR